MKCPKAVKGQFSHIQGVLALNVFYNMVMRRFDTQQNPRFYNDLFDLKTISNRSQNYLKTKPISIKSSESILVVSAL